MERCLIQTLEHGGAETVSAARRIWKKNEGELRLHRQPHLCWRIVRVPDYGGDKIDPHHSARWGADDQPNIRIRPDSRRALGTQGSFVHQQKIVDQAGNKVIGLAWQPMHRVDNEGKVVSQIVIAPGGKP